MHSVNLLILIIFLPVLHSNPFPTLPPFSTVSPETANAYLRSFLPWWPNETDFTLKSAPTPPESGNSTENSTANSTEIIETSLGATDEYENKTSTDTGEEELDASMLRVQDVPSSPLDEFSPESAPKNFISDSINHHNGNFIINFDEMGDCPRDCSSDLREALGIVLKDMSHVERYHQICDKYLNASACVNEDIRCDKDDRGMFEVMTSGLHYMCVEQELAFNATIKCIDDEAGLVQSGKGDTQKFPLYFCIFSECDAQCQTKNLFMNWMMRTAMADTIQQGVSGIVGAATGTNPNPLGFLQNGAAGGAPTGWADILAQRPPSAQDAQQGFENFRQFTNDLCRIGDCMLDCIRSKFNTRCEGSAGTLLSEVFVRPIAASQNKLSILRPVLGSFMPEQCNYLHNNADLKKHRIDSTMDEELKRMYAEKMAKEIRDRTTQDELLSNLVPLDENGVPLPRALPELKSIDSPLDVSVKTLDQLSEFIKNRWIFGQYSFFSVLEMYSKNETKPVSISDKKNAEATSAEPEKVEAVVNKTVETTTAKTVSNVTYETTTIKDEYVEKTTPETSGEVSLDDTASGNFTEASGEGSSEEEYSGSSGEASGDYESSGSTREASGDDLLTDNETSGEGYSGETDSSGEKFDAAFESSGRRQTDNYSEASGEETSGEGSSESSGEGSGEYESSGQEVLPLTRSDDMYKI
ncbi:CRE-CPG-4 protein [Caenorhabditis remanei]|uniref:CRE-CPG-4 protein n=1 Tax=Caenorhabditis remanei TaxID=31234 RepID=E3LUK1_CAERE|nr:CRE-CPG-4 protein [Caenorhabditis remanei]